MPKIKPCPFCGDCPKLFKSYLDCDRSDPRFIFDLEWTIRCNHCKFEFKATDKFYRNAKGDIIFETDGLYEVINKWNERS